MIKKTHIKLSNVIHRKHHQILITFNYNTDVISILKSIDGTRWSVSLKSWYIKNTKENLEKLTTALNEKATIDSANLKTENLVIISKKLHHKNILNKDQKELLNNFYRYLKGKRYSDRTVDTYTFYLADLIAFYNKKKTDELTNRDIEIYIETIFIRRKYSISTQRQFISAVKIFIQFYPISKIEELQLIRPKKSRKLPSVLSQEEVITLIRVTTNLKHRTIIALLYSCGLRISELINLELTNININRKQLVVISGKGRKDRYVSIAESFIPLFKNYLYSYNPKKYFVEGLNNNKYSAESIRHFIKKNSIKANIFKNVTPHILRHSYATHLLENGVDIRYIQSLLGHARPETTMIYTHVKRADLLEITNPLDIAIKKMKNIKKNQQQNTFIS